MEMIGAGAAFVGLFGMWVLLPKLFLKKLPITPAAHKIEHWS